MKKIRAALMLALLAFCMLVDPNTKPALAQTPRPPEQPDMQVDASARKEVVDTLVKRLNEAYVFPETAAKIEQTLRSHEAEYAQITSARQFAEKLTADLQAVSHDKHLRVRYSFESIPVRTGDSQEPTAAEREQIKQQLDGINYGFERVERLPGNIGYIDLRGFAPADIGGSETVAAAFNFLAHTNALIIDLRKNGGGDPAQVARICSYLFGSEPVHLNDLHWRDGKGERVQEFWTQKDVPGQRYDKDVYVLTSNYTFSGAEEFTNNLKTLKRATIIGETTGGGANPGGGNRLSEHFGAFIPTGRAVNPITKTNWEGTGVEPDVKVPADQALNVAQLSVLKKSLETTKDEQMKGAIQRRMDELQKELNEKQSKQAKM